MWSPYTGVPKIWQSLTVVPKRDSESSDISKMLANCLYSEIKMQILPQTMKKTLTFFKA